MAHLTGELRRSRNAAAAHDGPASPRTVRRWRMYLADERAEAKLYRQLASRRKGEEREILLELAEAEGRHENHWLMLLGDHAGKPRRTDLRTSLLVLFARAFGSVFVLALAQRAEARSPYEGDKDATSAMAADEAIHEEVIRGLAERGRNRLSGTFRAAVFGANDGLVSNLSLVLGVTAAGIPSGAVLATGIAGLLAGALSMGAGGVRLGALSAGAARRVDARPGCGQSAQTPGCRRQRARARLSRSRDEQARRGGARDRGARSAQRQSRFRREDREPRGDRHRFRGCGVQLLLFRERRDHPDRPVFFRATGIVAGLIAAGLVGLALLGTGSVVGLLSGGSPLKRALRQLAIGFGAAAVTYLLGLLFHASGA